MAENKDKRTHTITMRCNGVDVSKWEEYEFTASLIEPSQSFSLRRPWDPDAWNVFTRDSEVTILIDGVKMIVGYVDRRKKRSKDHTMEISGRCKSGRVVQTSAPRVDYTGLSMDQVVLSLVRPFYQKVTLSDARNRRLRMGKGYKIPGLNGDLVIQTHDKSGASSPFGKNPDKIARSPASSGAKAHPGETRWAVIEEILSQAGLIAWGSADGTEFFVGVPDQEQPPSFIFRLADPSSGNQTTVKELDYEEDNGDRFAMYSCAGAGGGSAEDYGPGVASRRGVVYDNPTNRRDGVGRDFQREKSLLMPEDNFQSNDEAMRVALQTQRRRDFKRATATVTMPMHGQFIAAGSPTLFAPNTVAWVIDEEMAPWLDDNFVIYECAYKCNRKDGETTMMQMVPAGTEFVH